MRRLVDEECRESDRVASFTTPEVEFPRSLHRSNRLDETEEGIPKKLAVFYYARWKFIQDLVPLLQKAKESGQAASVMSVLSPFRSNKIDLDDLGLKKKYNLPALAAAGGTYTDLVLGVRVLPICFPLCPRVDKFIL